MKKLLILLAAISAMILPSCIKQHFFCRYVNCTEENITIVLGYLDGRSDTTIVIDAETGDISPVMEVYCTLPPNGTKDVVIVSNDSDEGACNDYMKKYNGVLHIFIVRTADIEKYGWKHMVENDMVLQRYDLDSYYTKWDNTSTSTYYVNYEGLNIYFPPTPGMGGLSMWPPYGTYSIKLPND